MTVGDFILGIGVVANVWLCAWTLWRTKSITNTIQHLENNTNSIKDALIKATAEIEHAKGVIVGMELAKAQDRQPEPANDPD